jgi:hypothetical protein
MSLATGLKDTDIALEFNLAVNGTALDLTTATEIEVKVYQRKDDIIAAYLLSDNEVTLNPSVEGFCECIFAKESNVNIPATRTFVQIVVTLTNADYPNGTQTIGISDIPFISFIDKA